jgi:hypothetical protein
LIVGLSKIFSTVSYGVDQYIHLVQNAIVVGRYGMQAGFEELAKVL